jgi:hypothetical protein
MISFTGSSRHTVKGILVKSQQMCVAKADLELDLSDCRIACRPVPLQAAQHSPRMLRSDLSKD